MSKNRITICLFLIFISIFTLCSCNSNNETTKSPKETIELTENNIDNYVYYTYIYTSNNMSQTRHGITYNAYIIEINFYPKNINVNFENFVVVLGRFAGATDYTYTIYVDQNGYGQYRNQVWIQSGWEQEAFTQQYYNIQGNVLIY